MERYISRRETLAAGAGTALAVVGVGPAAGAGACDDYRDLEDTVTRERRTLSERQAERDSLRADLASYQQTIREARDEARGPHPYDEATREAARAVGLEARSGMVFLEMIDGPGVTTASAWFVDEHLLLTNNHNVSDVTSSTSLHFWTIDGEKHSFEVVDRSEMGPDVALLRTESSAPKVLPTGSADSVSTGDLLVQVGNPGGFGKWVLTLGELKERSTHGDLVTSVPGLQGVSGSPLLDMDGKVVGMTYAGQPRMDWEPGQRPMPSPTDVEIYPMVPESDGLHVPIKDALDLLEDWT